MLNAKPEIFYCCLKLINARIIAKKSEVQKLYMQMMSYFILNLIAYAIFIKYFFSKIKLLSNKVFNFYWEGI